MKQYLFKLIPFLIIVSLAGLFFSPFSALATASSSAQITEEIQPTISLSPTSSPVPSSASPSASLSASPSSITVVLKEGSLILLKVAGETTEAAGIESFLAEKSFWEYGPADFVIRIKNNGNVHVKPKGTIAIANIFGKEVAKFPINPRNVLPGAIRKIPVVWHQKSLIGKYTATISLVYGTQNQILTASTNFFGFPYKIGGAILLGLIILVVSLYKGRKRVGLALKVLFSGKNK